MENRSPAVQGIATVPTPSARSSPAYQGVWVRTLLETPAGRDTSTWVRWVQTERWHGSFEHSGESATACIDGPGTPHNVFQTSDRIVQTGLHDRHLAVWERLPDSRGQRVALARRDPAGQPTQELLLVCGDYVLLSAPRVGAPPLLAFGHLDGAQTRWDIERASAPMLAGTTQPWHLQRLGLDLARVDSVGLLDGGWEVLEWVEA